MVPSYSRLVRTHLARVGPNWNVVTWANKVILSLRERTGGFGNRTARDSPTVEIAPLSLFQLAGIAMFEREDSLHTSGRILFAAIPHRRTAASPVLAAGSAMYAAGRALYAQNRPNWQSWTPSSPQNCGQVRQVTPERNYYDGSLAQGARWDFTRASYFLP